MSRLAEGIERVQEQSGGMIHLTLIEPNTVPDIIRRLEEGDPEAQLLFAAISDTMLGVRDAKPDKPKRCFCCPRRLRLSRFVVGAVIPARNSPRNGLGFGVCFECLRETPDIGPKVLKALRTIWPDAHSLQVNGTTADMAEGALQ